MDPVLSDLEVACLISDAARYSTPPLGYPTKSSFTEDATKSLDSTDPSSNELTKLVQGAFFFGVLADVCHILEVHFDSSDLVAKEPSRQLISCRGLEKYIWFFVAAEHDLSIDAREDHQAAYIEILKRASHFVNQRNANLLYAADRTDSETDEATVLISVMAVVDYLAHNTHNIFQLDSQRPKLDWGRSPLLDSLLLETGWCRGELKTLHAECGPVTLLYFATIDRTRGDKNQGCCTDYACVVNQLDNETYEPAHSPTCMDCAACTIVEAPVDTICDILNSGRGIPLVRVVETETGIQLKTKNFAIGKNGSQIRYTAISHVWSDGMGNPKVNGLYSCQLRRIQSRVNVLYPESHGNEFFWMDTLCVPLRSSVRNKAIILMTKTFAQATKVLVLDRWLESCDLTQDTRQLISRVAKCDWNTRLWTYNELVLARECWFQFTSKPANLADVMDHVRLTQNIRVISNQLQQLQLKDFTRWGYAVKLLKAITDLDQSVVDRAAYYANLSPEDDEYEETLCLHAAEIYNRFAEQNEIMPIWKPMLERLGDLITFKPAEDALRSRITIIVIDPILSHGLKILNRLGGMFYSTSMDRSHDVGGISRQIHGFKTQPHVLFLDVGGGLSGRTTSRPEDETICLGGMLGLDVSPILEIGIDHEKRQDQETGVCDKRMKVFLSQIGKIPPTVLFSNVPKVQLPGFHWAPRTFLSATQTIRRGAWQLASITDKGLLFSNSGIRLPGLRVSDIGQNGILHIEYPSPDTRDVPPDIPPHRRSWLHIKVAMEACSSIPDMHNFQSQELVLIMDPDSEERGFLAILLSEQEGESLSCQYLMYASRILSQVPQNGFSVKGSWFRKRPLCIS